MQASAQFKKLNVKSMMLVINIPTGMFITVTLMCLLTGTFITSPFYNFVQHF